MGRYIDEHLKWQSRKLGRWLHRALVVIFPSLFIMLLVLGPGLVTARFLPCPMGFDLGLRLALGLPISIVGIGLYLWTIGLFARAGGTQVPLVPTQRVVSTGPYAVTRNPMVTSAGIMVCGVAVLLGSWSFLIAGLLIPSPYLLYIKLVEEKELAARFGTDYLAYKKTTPFIVPRLPLRRHRQQARSGQPLDVVTVLFACVHNAGRSQMAAALFNALADPTKARAISAGTQPGDRVHPEVVTVMNEADVDLSTARPRCLTDELARSAQWLVTMGCGDACPVVPGSRREDWALPDPKGQPLDRVREIREDIRARVERLVSENGWGR